MASRLTKSCGALLLCALFLSGCAKQSQSPSRQIGPKTTSRPAVPDPHLWTRRNLDLIRETNENYKKDRAERNSPYTAFMFSVGFNPMFLQEPYRSELLALAREVANDAAADEFARSRAQDSVWYLSLPQEEREIRFLLGATDRDEKDKQGPTVFRPILQTAGPGRVISDLTNVPTTHPWYEQRVPKWIEQVDSAARQRGNWGELSLAYLDLAYDARKRNRPDRLALYVDRMLAILREHPEFPDPQSGNTRGIMPVSLATFMQEIGREKDLQPIVAQLEGLVRIEFVLHEIGALVSRRNFGAAAALVESSLRPLDPASADRITLAFRGQFQPTTLPTTRPKDDRRNAELYSVHSALVRVESAIASDPVIDGDVEKAARQLEMIGADRLYKHSAKPSARWFGLGERAHQSGHREAARKAFDRSTLLMMEEKGDGQATTERVELIRRALELDDIALAREFYTANSPPWGAWSRWQFGMALRKRGDLQGASAAWDEALAMARTDRGAQFMTRMAVELYKAGETAHAEELLLESTRHVDGQDFGLGGVGSIISAATQMNRLDLLDQIYERSHPLSGMRLLLCVIAPSYAFYGWEAHDVSG